jgi:F0F1-type ATP synthase epsilon subunit
MIILPGSELRWAFCSSSPVLTTLKYGVIKVRQRRQMNFAVAGGVAECNRPL